jgi:hypothetical protein
VKRAVGGVLTRTARWTVVVAPSESVTLRVTVLVPPVG